MKRIIMIMAMTLITAAVFAAEPTPVPRNLKTGKTVKMMIKVPVQIVDGAYVAQVGDDIKTLTTGGIKIIGNCNINGRSTTEISYNNLNL